MRHCLYCASDTSCVNYAACSSLIMQTRWFEAICAFWERKRARWFTQAVYEIMSHRKFQITFMCYLMNNYELHFTFSIIMISPVPDRVWDVAAACHANPHQLEIVFFLDRPFRDRQSNTPKRLSVDNDQYPINRSTPSINILHACISCA